VFFFYNKKNEEHQKNRIPVVNLFFFQAFWLMWPYLGHVEFNFSAPLKNDHFLLKVTSEKIQRGCTFSDFLYYNIISPLRDF
jgi:hypothetical protein